MTKSELRSIKTALAHFKTAYAGGGTYCPSDAQTNAIKTLWIETSGVIEKRDSARLAKLLMSIDNAYLNEVYCIGFTLEQIVAIEKALAKAK